MSHAYAAPQSRTALIIGNTAYEHGPLRTPLNNATDLAALLPQLGFEVTVLHAADLRTMEDAIQTWRRRLRQEAVGLFYFAGHGVQIGGDVYLLPLRMCFEQEQDVREKALPIYTKHLLRSLATPGLSLEELFRQVRRGVLEETGGHQTPWEVSSVAEPFLLVPTQAGTSQPPLSFPAPRLLPCHSVSHNPGEP